MDISELPEKQRKVYELREREDPVPFRDIAVMVGLSYEGVRSCYKKAQLSLLGEFVPADIEVSQRKAGRKKRLEAKDPETAAAMIDAVTDPRLKSVAKACRDANFPYEATRALIKRLERDFQPVSDAVTRVKTETLVKEFEGLALRSLASITDEDLEKLDAYKRTLVAAIAADKRELLDGRPTERISVEDRRKLPELMSALMVEAKRRGLVEHVDPETNKARLVQGDRDYVDTDAKVAYKPVDPVSGERI